MSSQNTLLQIIKDSPLSETTKDFFVKQVEKNGASQENILALRQLLRATKHQIASDMGLEVDPSNDPLLKTAQDQMHSDLRMAADRYTKTMKRLEEESERLAVDIQADLAHLEKIVVNSAQAEV